MKEVIYNVLIGGYSIGMTFNHNEAISWVQQSMFNGPKQIIPVRYKAS